MTTNGITLAVIGDVHHALGKLAQVLDHVRQTRDTEGVHGILLVGDIGSNALSWHSRRTPERDAAYLESVDDVLRAVEALGLPVAYVPGNHDLPELARPASPGNCDGRVVDVGGLRVGGIGGAGPAKFGFCYEWDEDDIRARPDLACDVLLCHCPPLGVLDRTARGARAGSLAILERARSHRGFLVCGHIHEAPGVERVEQCLCVNAGGLGRPYGAPQVAYIRRGADGDTAWHLRLSS